MLFDSHMHTKFSADSEMQIEEALDAGEKKGLGLVFTEHLDLDYPGDTTYAFDPAAYWQAYEPFRGEHLRLGIEVGLQPGQAVRVQEFLQRAPFDQVIGSIHVVDQQDIYYPKFYQNREKTAAYRQYLLTMAEVLTQHPFVDVLGHIDYITRYAPYEDPNLCYADLTEEIDGVLQTAIDTETVLELNTRRLGDRQALKSLVPIYQRYHDLGGAYLTFGSDAHMAGAIGGSFTMAKEFADACDLQVVTFNQRKMELCADSSCCYSIG